MPSLTNVGVMRKTDLNALLKSFPEGKVDIKVGTIMITVYDQNGQQIMSAAKMHPYWHVRAVPGLIEKRYL